MNSARFRSSPKIQTGSFGSHALRSGGKQAACASAELSPAGHQIYHKRTHEPVFFRALFEILDTRASNSEQHFILDFQAGKDVGLGMFGIKDGSSTVNFGVRIAQFQSKSNIALKSDPDWRFHTNMIQLSEPDAYGSQFRKRRTSSQQLGQLYRPAKFPRHRPVPVVERIGAVRGQFAGRRIDTRLGHECRASVRPAKNENAPSDDGTVSQELARRSIRKRHQPLYYPTPPHHSTRSRNVTVPNIGGFAGLSFAYPNAKISLGYQRRLLLRCHRWRHRCAQKRKPRLYGPLCQYQYRVGGLGAYRDCGPARLPPSPVRRRSSSCGGQVGRRRTSR